MIDHARAFVDLVDGRRTELREAIATASQELGQLDELVAPLRGFIDPPEREEGAPNATPVPASRSADASSPPGGVTPAITQPGSRATGQGSRRRPPSTSLAGPAAPASLPCPDCDFVARTVGGLGVHRRKRHGVAGATATTRERVQHTGTIPPAPMSEAKNGHPSSSEKFLCGSCDAPFPSYEERAEHQAEGTCARVPTRPPTGDRIPFTLPGSDPGMVAGLGE